jgi:uncharacterized protein VirK/YbjX
MEGPGQVSWRESRKIETEIRTLDVLRMVVRGSSFALADAEPVQLSSVTKCIARGVFHWRTIRSWLADPANAALQETLPWRPSLVRCVARPYLTERWGPARKLAAIAEHHRLLRGRLAFLRFHPSRSILLGTAAGCVQISLEKASWFEHEGELTLSLFCDGTRVYSLVFTLGEVESRTVAYVGALQGLGRADALAIYRALTRRLQGLRPRDLLIAAFRSLCVALEVKRILAVSDSACVGRSAYFARTARVHSSYDRAWTESGAIAAEDGFFELSPTHPRRAMSEIPSRKRAEHRRRFEMLDELAVQVDRAVERAAVAFRPSPARPRVVASGRMVPGEASSPSAL